MGEVALASTGLMSKISILFNNSLFSDVEFLFDCGSKLYGHKLILSLRSKAFAHMFYENKISERTLKLPASKRPSFFLLFKFLYTDDVQFHTFEEAQDLCELATAYAVDELVGICNSYMQQYKVTIKNIFPRYEHALKRNLEKLLRDCREFVCSNTQLILQSTEFIIASPEVIEDIVKQDNLTLSTEFELITAVLNWGSESLKRKGINKEKHLRECIDRFLKHLRILTLTPSEFAHVVEHHSIFTAFESMTVTRKLFQPNCNAKLPESISFITTKRNNVLLNYEQSVKLSLPEQLSSVSPSPVPSKISNITYEVKYPGKENTVSSQQKQKFNSSPDIRKQLLIASPMYDLSQNRFRDYIFPLMENNMYFSSSFRYDVKSVVEFKMKSGNLMLFGFELKVKNIANAVDKLNVSIYLNGFSKQPFFESYQNKLCNDVFTVNFKKQMVLKEGNIGELEVSVGNLSLKQCSICNGDEPYEFNNGLDFVCELHVRSNKKTEAGFIFLIWKLKYAKC